jgi:phosphoglycolate phosphatase-like HAD superfamily hydrolase
MGKPTLLLLWDVDHTLIENGGVSKETYALAYELLTGVSPVHLPQTDGRTDPTIMRELFTSNGLDFTADYADQLSSTLIEAMKRKASALAQRGYTLPGAESILSMLSRDPTIVQSVLTGNIMENARAKLAPFGLDKYLDFEVGAFGSDDAVRSRLVAVAQRRASRKYATEFGPGSTVLVGDTLRDVEAGRQGGAWVIGVATGIDSEATLRQAGAHEVLADLADPRSFVAALGRLCPDRPMGA